MDHGLRSQKHANNETGGIRNFAIEGEQEAVRVMGRVRTNLEGDEAEEDEEEGKEASGARGRGRRRGGGGTGRRHGRKEELGGRELARTGVQVARKMANLFFSRTKMVRAHRADG
jgi:hypothetical protein